MWPLTRLRSLLGLLTGFRRRRAMDERFGEETRFHLDMAVERNVRAGMTPEAAERAARLAFGARARFAEEARDEVRSRPVEDLARDLRYAIRSLRQAPAFTVAALVTLALSIGATTSIFSVVNVVLLRDLPYPDPARIAVLCELNNERAAAKRCNVLNPGNFLAWGDVARSFSAMGAFRETRVSLAGAGTEPVSAETRVATAGVYSILGARAALGRMPVPADDSTGAPNVVVLSHAFWRHQFGGDSSVVGRTVQLNTFPYSVVGVAAPELTLYQPVDIWIPLHFSPQERTTPGRSLRGIARLRPGVTLDQADREMRALAATRAAELPQVNANWTAFVMPIRASVVGGSERALWALLAAVGFLLVIACANVANLQLARAAGRAREVAVRMSLGASPGRVVRQLLTESVVLSLTAGAIGFVVAWKGTAALVALVPAGVSGQTLADVHPDWRVLAFTAVVAMSTGILFGLTPAYHATRTDVQQSLKEGGRGGMATSRSTGRLRSTLVVAELSVALVLLAGAGLMVRSFAALHHVPLGFDPAHALTARLTLPRAKYSNDTLTLGFFQGVEAGVAALPGVTAVGSISYLPLTGERSASGFNVADRPAAAPGTEPTGDMRAVTPGYFAAMGIRIVEGRGLTAQDGVSTPSVAVVSRTLARTMWPGERAVGHYLLYQWYNPERVEIVGVAEDVHHAGVDKEPFMEIYRPLAQFPYAAMSIVVRGTRDAAQLAGPLRNAVHAIDPDLPVAQLTTLDALVAQSLGTTRLSTTLFALFGGLGLLLAAVGVYGVMSYAVAQRRHEIGVRMALGAGGGAVVALVMRRGAALTLIGIAFGTVGALLATRLMRSLLFGVPPDDATTFVATAAILGGVALGATGVPGFRAARVDPVAVLRGE